MSDRFECRNFDLWVGDYLDEALGLEQRRAADEHLTGCEDCREALAETELAVAALSREPAVEPPPDLIAVILDETIGYRAGATVAAGAGGGWTGLLKGFLNPFTQPRFVMSMAMTALSFSMLTFYGQRALESWRSPESTPAVQALENFREDVTLVWEEAVAMTEAARGFLELQTTGDAEGVLAPPPAADEEEER